MHDWARAGRFEVEQATDVGRGDGRWSRGLQGGDLLLPQAPRQAGLQQRVGAGGSTATVVGERGEIEAEPRQKLLADAGQLQPMLQSAGRVKCDQLARLFAGECRQILSRQNLQRIPSLGGPEGRRFRRSQHRRPKGARSL